MELNIVYGRAGSGKSQYCINNLSEIVNENLADNAYLIVPDQFTVEAEKRFLKSVKTGGLIKSEVLSFKRMSHWVLDKFGGVNKPSLNVSGKAMVLSLAIKNVSSKLSFYKNFAENPWNADALFSLISEFLRYGVTEDDVDQSAAELKETNSDLSVKLSEIATVYREFRRLLGINYMDDIKVHEIMMSHLKTNRPFENSVVWIDEFTGFTTLECEIIKELVCQCKSVNVCLTYEKGSDAVFSVTAKTLSMLRRIVAETGTKVTETEIKPEILPRFSESRALLELQNRFGKYPTEEYDGNAEDVIVYSCSDSFEEIYNCGLEIQRLCDKGDYAFKDITVMVRDLKNYQDIFASIFRDFNIRFFLDNKEGLDSFPITACIIDALDIICNDYTNESVFSFMKSECTGFDKDAVNYLENYTIQYGIRNKRKWIIPIAERPSLELQRNRLMKGFNTLEENFKKSENFSDAIKAIYDFIDYFGIEKYAESQKTEEFGTYDIWEYVDEALTQIDDFLGDISLKKYSVKRIAETIRCILVNGFSKYDVGKIPFDTDTVKIGEADRIRTGEIKALFIVGANEGVFPRSFSDTGILSDKERLILEEHDIKLADTIRSQAEIEDFIMYTAVTAPRNRLYVSYSNFSGKDNAYPSQIVRRIQKLLPNCGTLKTETVKYLTRDVVKTDRNNASVTDHEQFVSEDIVELLYKKDESGSVAGISGLENYADCPYQFFLKYGIGAGDRKNFDIDSTDTGILLHGLVEKSTKKLFESKSEKPSNIDECRKIIDEVYDEAVADYKNRYVFEDSAKNLFITDKLKDFAAASLEKIVDQSKTEGYVPKLFEVSFGQKEEDLLPPLVISDDDGNEIKLSGRIDRLDVFKYEGKKYYRIIDYKSSDKPLRTEEITDGTQMQLIAYLSKVLSDNSDSMPGGVFYCTIPTKVTETTDESFGFNGIGLDDENSKKAMSDKMGRNTVTEAEFDALFKTTDNNIVRINKEIKCGKISSGEIYDKNKCKFCSYADICISRYI